jgi:hypothetical protein
VGGDGYGRSLANLDLIGGVDGDILQPRGQSAIDQHQPQQAKPQQRRRHPCGRHQRGQRQGHRPQQHQRQNAARAGHKAGAQQGACALQSGAIRRSILSGRLGPFDDIGHQRFGLLALNLGGGESSRRWRNTAGASAFTSSGTT